MNESSYETLNLSTIDENDHEHRHEYIVKSETLSTLSVLAKFLGLIMARPFNYEFGINATVDTRQIELRNKVTKQQQNSSQTHLKCANFFFSSFFTDSHTH